MGFQGQLLDSLKESEIENITILQSVNSWEVKGVLQSKTEMRPVEIEPDTF